MDILLIGDEDKAMINKYLESSKLFALYDNDILTSICAVMEIDKETVEIKNLATYTQYQNKGYASALINFVCNKYKTNFKYLILGTNEKQLVDMIYLKKIL